VAFEPGNAELLGIDVRRIRTAAFVISGALAGLAGALTTLSLDLASPYLSEGILVKGFAIIVLGGMGSVRGAILGALMLGIVEVATVTVGLSAYRDAAPALLLFVVLMLKPAGLFGRREVLRA
jgi:branched-chain amino acid transport system permease protein